MRNGEPPPTPRDESEREFYECMGVVMLDTDEANLMGIFFRFLEFDEIYKLNLELLRAYCKHEEMDFLLVYELLNPALYALSKEYYKKAKN